MRIKDFRRRFLILLAPLPVVMGIQYLQDPERVLFIAVVYLAGVACGGAVALGIVRYFGGLRGLARTYQEVLLRCLPRYAVERPYVAALVAAGIGLVLGMALVSLARIVGMVVGLVTGVEPFS